MAGERVYLGVDLGGSKTAVATWLPDGTCLGGPVTWPTVPDPAGNLDRALQESRTLIGGLERGSRSLAAVGISAGGPVDPSRGVLLSVPNLSGWDNVPLGEFFSGELGVPTRVENDANACALAEWMHGAGRGAASLVFLTFSTGVGAGLILDGRLYRGARLLAGEAGHQTIVPGGLRCGCGNRGCLEAYASGAGIARRLSALQAERSEGRAPVSAREVVERARAGDPFSLRFLEETASFLALGVANLVYILNPERVILGTIAVGAGDLLLEPLRRELSRLVWPELLEGLEVLPAGLGTQLGHRAALAVALSVDRPQCVQ